jgi:hypothetical protein
MDQEKMPAYSELKRRLDFEYNGMILHEYYFGNLKKGGGPLPPRDSSFLRAVEDSFGSFEDWRSDFASVGKMRGVGWAASPAGRRSASARVPKPGETWWRAIAGFVARATTATVMSRTGFWTGSGRASRLARASLPKFRKSPMTEAYSCWLNGLIGARQRS